MSFAVMRRWIIPLVLGLVVGLSASAPAAVTGKDPAAGWAAIAARVLPATVNIRVVKIALD